MKSLRKFGNISDTNLAILAKIWTLKGSFIGKGT